MGERQEQQRGLGATVDASIGLARSSFSGAPINGFDVGFIFQLPYSVNVGSRCFFMHDRFATDNMQSEDFAVSCSAEGITVCWDGTVAPYLRVTTSGSFLSSILPLVKMPLADVEQ